MYFNSVTNEHCAWGWVDTDLTDAACDSIDYMKVHNIGVAGTLTDEDVDFATALQSAHDSGASPGHMRSKFVALAAHFGLVAPVTL